MHSFVGICAALIWWTQSTYYDIVAHSYGGQVTTRLLAVPEFAKRVQHIAFTDSVHSSVSSQNAISILQVKRCNQCVCVSVCLCLWLVCVYVSLQVCVCESVCVSACLSVRLSVSVFACAWLTAVGAVAGCQLGHFGSARQHARRSASARLPLASSFRRCAHPVDANLLQLSCSRQEH
jgi:hypothetical protein